MTNTIATPDPAEPVPPATQLALLPFLAAIEGVIRESTDAAKPFRVTMHRLLWRHDKGYLQQACDYLGTHGKLGGVGRIFPVDEALIGATFKERRVLRTKHYDDEQTLLADLARDMAATGDRRNVADVAKSYLTVPFLAADEPVLIFYGESDQVNFFADDNVVRSVVAMCQGLARLLDDLEERAVPMIRNFPSPRRPDLSAGGSGRYPTIHEVLGWSAPQFERVSAVHYDVASR